MFREKILKLMNSFNNLRLNMSDSLAKTLFLRFKMIKLFNKKVFIAVNVLLITFKTKKKGLKKII